MADFYQILKREIEPKNLEIVERKTNNNSKVSNNTVDNFDNDSQPATQKIVTKLAKKQSAKKNLSSSMRRFSRKDTFLSLEPRNPIWLTMNETAILGGIQKRTVKRALRAGLIKYRIVTGRYQVNFTSALIFFHSRKKIWNKVKDVGLGQYVEKWRS